MATRFEFEYLHIALCRATNKALMAYSLI